LDLARALGTTAHLTSLRRESVGDFHVSSAWQLSSLIKEMQRAGEAGQQDGLPGTPLDAEAGLSTDSA
jgi:tRNA U55 pseudouridine synthase TruB